MTVVCHKLMQLVFEVTCMPILVSFVLFFSLFGFAVSYYYFVWFMLANLDK